MYARLFHAAAAAGLMLGLFATGAAAQVQDAQEWLERCRQGEARWGNARERVCEVREVTLAADGRMLTVDGRQNGGITVQAWDRNEIRVQALITAHAATAQQARAHAEAISVRTDDHTVRAEGPAAGDNEGWSVSYRVWVPNQTDLQLRARNGGLSVENVSGRIELETTNGGIRLSQVGGDVQGRTVNGGVTVRLAGQRWQGGGLDLRTTNGGVNLHVPQGYSAQLETGTVNGRINTDIPVTVQGDSRRTLSTQLGEGGAPIRVRTTNGSVRIQRS
jgi:hypothetical protein